MTPGADRILAELRSFHGELAAQQEALNGQMAAVGSAIEAMGATPAPARARVGRPAGAGPGRPGRPKGSGGRPGSLKDFMMRVLKQTSRPLSPKEIASNIVRAGYKTKAKDLTKAVSNALPQLKGIKKMGFGQYRV